jgi:hypothetical protein
MGNECAQLGVVATALPVAVLWGVHAPSRAGDDALIIALLFHGGVLQCRGRVGFGEAPNPAREARALPRTTGIHWQTHAFWRPSSHDN